VPDLKELHAKFGQQALEIDFLSSVLTKAGLLFFTNKVFSQAHCIGKGCDSSFSRAAVERAIERNNCAIIEEHFNQRRVGGKHPGIPP
jgi:hypothetical protein